MIRRSKSLEEALNEYLPANCAGQIIRWFDSHKVVLRITRGRKSKLGDFRTGSAMNLPVISVNHNLNPYSFLVTLLHEMAHAEVHHTVKQRTQPHGIHWKLAYQKLAVPFLEKGLLPDDVRSAFAAYLVNPLASSTAYLPLAAALRNYDLTNNGTLISELPADALFALPDGRLFRKGPKLRKRYQCKCLTNKRIYLFSPLAEIIPLAAQQIPDAG